MKRIADLVRTAPALIIAMIVLLPIFSVLVMSLDVRDDTALQFFNPAFRRYVLNTAILAASVAVLAGTTGVLAAWAVVYHEFPGRNVIEYLLFLPLAIPAYVGAYAIVDFLEYAGPVQTLMRSVFGWESATEYLFPQIRSMGGAIIVLSAGLYPYVYMLTRISLREQSGASLEVASTLGRGPFYRFFHIGLPLVRPGIIAGLALVIMETIADFGVVDYFAVQTLTTRIYTVWFQAYDIGTAARLSSVILVIVAVIILLERILRFRSRYHQGPMRGVRHVRQHMGRLSGLLVTMACLGPVAIGFLLPVGVLLTHAIGHAEQWLAPGLGDALMNSIITAGSAAAITVLCALWLVYWSHVSTNPLPGFFLPLTSLGYAAPGIVIGIGILIPVTLFDHALADMLEHVSGTDPGLLLTGSAGVVVLAYTVRFFAIAQGAVDAALGRVSPAVNLVSRTLGRSAGGTLVKVQLPIIKGSLLTAALLVFVDCVKELPATLLLKPFNFNTLATRIYEHASLENLSAAAPAALLITIVGGVGTIILARSSRSLS